MQTGRRSITCKGCGKEIPEPEGECGHCGEPVVEVQTIAAELPESAQGSGDQDAMLGGQLGDYRVDEVIGRGGMGVVYRATDLRLDRQVALKLIAHDFAQDSEFRRRFIAESHAAAAIDHPNVLPIYETGEEDGVLFMACRYVLGTDLKAIIRREGPLEPERAVNLIAQVAAALDVAHARGLVHRDVKPHNVLVSTERGTTKVDHAYLTDFGLAKDVAAPPDVTRTGHFVGTADYAAPEQIRGDEVDARTDVYSLGCLFFEALTGSPPFRHDTAVGVLWGHLQEPPPAISSLRDDTSPALDSALAKAMAKSPAERYRSCSEFVAAADAALAEAPLRSRRFGIGRRRRGGHAPGPQSLSRSAAVALLAASVAALGVLATLGILSFLDDSGSGKTAAPVASETVHGDKDCGGGVSVESSVVSCPFALNVAEEYSRTGNPEISVLSPTTGQKHTMICSASGRTIVCRGVNDIVVYIN